MKNNIISYVRKYGDKTFEEMPLNNVDCLIFSQLSYINYDGLVYSYKENKNNVLLKNLKKYIENEELYYGIIMGKETKELFQLLVDAKRFNVLRLNYYTNNLEKDIEQFCAITLMSDTFTYVSYRGTDVSFTGWKEDFEMTFTQVIPAQISAVKYLNAIGNLTSGDIYISGHSKGGNLAMYAFMNCNEDVKRKVIRAYNHDGPGFESSVFESTNYMQTKDRMISIFPYSSVVGMLLHKQGEYRVVESCRHLIFQHDPFSWLIEDTDFKYCDEVSGRSLFLSDSLNEWLKTVDHEKRELFVNTIFDVFEASGVNDFFELPENFLQNAMNMLKKTQSIDAETRKLCMEMMYSLVNHLSRDMQKQSINKIKDKLNLNKNTE